MDGIAEHVADEPKGRADEFATSVVLVFSKEGRAFTDVGPANGKLGCTAHRDRGEIKKWGLCFIAPPVGNLAAESFRAFRSFSHVPISLLPGTNLRQRGPGDMNREMRFFVIFMFPSDFRSEFILLRLQSFWDCLATGHDPAALRHARLPQELPPFPFPAALGESNRISDWGM